MATSRLGEFLAAKRAVLSPADFPLAGTAPRRVPGLRRDEVAMLSSISVDYYARLEQGRERSPSPAVLAGLATALQLNPDETDHLHRLAGVAPETTPRPDADEITRRVQAVIDTWPQTAAFVLDPLLDVVALNSLARALFAPFTSTANLLHMVMLDPAGRTFYVEWERAAESCVAALRSTAHLGDPARLREITDALASSTHFVDLWARYEVRSKTTDRKALVLHHGNEVVVDLHTFTISGAPGFELVLYQAEAGTHSEQQLLQLGGHPARS